MNVRSKMKTKIAGTEKKQAILETTLQLITENGFHNAPMSLIAKRADVAAGTIYHHFESKEQIINALYALEKEKMGLALLQGIEQNGTYKKQFFQFWENLYTHFVKNPASFLFLEQYANSPFVAQVTREQNKHFYQPVIDFILLGMKKSFLRKMDVELAVALIYGNVVSAVKLQLSGELKMNTKRIEQAIQATWDAVRK
jgi:AcrR family transcriptional regulator